MTALAPAPAHVDAPQAAAPVRWIAGGLAAELAVRLRASVELIRLLLVVAFFLQPATWTAYAIAAVLIPRGGRRLPSWSGLVATGRVGLLVLLPQALSAGGLSVDEPGGPGNWIPLGALAAAGALVLLASAPSSDVDEARCRTQALGMVTVAGLAAALLGGMALAPGVRWDHVAAAAVAALGAILALTAGRSAVARAAVVPAAVLAVATLLTVASGARLQGGVGDQWLVPGRLTGDTLVVRRAAGDVVLDLRRVWTPSGALTVRATVGAGDLRIILPRHAHAEASLHTGRGTVSAADDRVRGLDVSIAAAGDPPPGAGRGKRIRVRIVAGVGIGELRVDRDRNETEGPGRI